MKLKGKLLWPVLVLLAAGGTAWWWQGAGARLAIVRETRPAGPDLSAVPDELRARIAAAEARAQGRRTAPKGLAELSRLYHANGFLEEAKQCYVGLERLDPGAARWPHLHATILAGFGEIEPAVALWRRTVELAPDYAPARLRLGDCLLKSNHPGEAAAAYAEVLKRNPENSYALLGLARIDLEAQRWDQARERLEKVVNQSHYALGYDLIVTLYERLGLKEQAASIRSSTKASGAYREAPDPWLDELIEFCFDPYRLAVAAGVAPPAGAIKLLERAIAVQPENVAYHFQLGCLAQTQGNLALAHEQLESCTRLAPNFADAWAYLSALQARQGNRAAAQRALMTGLANCPESPGLHLMRARNLRADGQLAEAINEYRTSILYRSNEPDAYVELGNLLITAGQEKEGIALMRRALETDPGDPSALAALAFYAVTTGDEAEARRWFARASLQPRVPAPQFAQLQAFYRQTFGHDWVPDRK